MPIDLPSAQSFLLKMCFGAQTLGTGTGFVAESSRGPVLITNRHNVTGRHNQTGQLLLPTTGAVPDRVQILHNSTRGLGAWCWQEELLYSSNDFNNPLWIEHPTLGPQADFVALPLTQLDDVQLYPYSLGVGDRPIIITPTSIVSVVGFPFGIQAGGSFAVWATGFVASEPDVDYADLPIFLIDSRSRPGQSGSAVIAHRTAGPVAYEDGTIGFSTGPVTRFLGIYSGRINDQSDIGLVWKATALQELVQNIT